MEEVTATGRGKGGKATAEYKKAAEDLAKREALTAEAVRQDLIHICLVANKMWNNADYPMVVRQKWRDLGSTAAKLRTKAVELEQFEKVAANQCYIIGSDGKLRRATCEEIFSALDNTPEN